MFTPNPQLNTIYFLGYIKLIITLIKYTPQVYWNWKRQSTVGWTIWNVLCDFCGGLFSFLQNLFDGINGSDIFGGLNTAKFALGIISMIYDVIFMIQHYILYNPNRKQN